jgi:hypothetical protein
MLMLMSEVSVVGSIAADSGVAGTELNGAHDSAEVVNALKA